MDPYNLLIPISIYFYYTLYNYIPNHPSIESKLQLDYKSRCTGIINASISSIGVFLYYILNNTSILYHTFYTIIGYFIVDAFYLYKLYPINKLSGTILFTFHHITALYAIITYSVTHTEVIARLFSCELSNVFMNITWIMYKGGRNNHILFKSCAFLTLLSYFITRILNFTHLTLTLHQYSNITPTANYIVYFFTCLNYYWFYKIIQVFLKIG